MLFLFHGFTYLLISFSGVFLRKFAGPIFKFLQGSVCEPTSIISESQTRKRRPVLAFTFSIAQYRISIFLSMLCPLEIFPPTQGELPALTMTFQVRAWCGHEVQRNPTWEQSHPMRKLGGSCNYIPVAPGDPVGPRMQELLPVWVFLIAPGMWLVRVKQNCTHVRCSTWMLQSKQFLQDQITARGRSTSYKPWTFFCPFFLIFKKIRNTLVYIWWDTFIRKHVKYFSAINLFKGDYNSFKTFSRSIN